MALPKRNIASIALVILCVVSRHELTAKKKTTDLIKDDDAKKQFERLLTSIANVNKERIDALKRYNALEDYNLAKGVFSNGQNNKRRDTHDILYLHEYDLERADDGVLYDYTRQIVREKPTNSELKELLQQFYEYDFTDSDEISNNKLSNEIQNPYNEYGFGNMSDIVNMGVEMDDKDDINIGADYMNDDVVAMDINNNRVYVNGTEDSSKNKYEYDDDEDAMRNYGHTNNSNCKNGRCSCIKACRCAYQRFCEKFSCTKKTKKLLCKNCRINCRLSFI